MHHTTNWDNHVSVNQQQIQGKWHKKCKCTGLKSADLDSSDKWQSGFQKQAIAIGCSERHNQKAKPAHKQRSVELLRLQPM